MNLDKVCLNRIVDGRNIYGFKILVHQKKFAFDHFTETYIFVIIAQMKPIFHTRLNYFGFPV